MFIYHFPAAILVYHGGTRIWRFHTGLCKFLRNISTNICSLGKRTGLNLDKCLISLTSITSQFRSFLYWIVFDLFFYCVTVKTIYRAYSAPLFSKWGILDNYQINTFQIAKFMYCYHNKLLPPQFFNLFFTNSQIHGYSASSLQLLKLENLLRWSLFTFIYNLSTNMNYFINTYILLDVLLCSIAEYFYELCRILTSP